MEEIQYFVSLDNDFRITVLSALAVDEESNKDKLRRVLLSHSYTKGGDITVYKHILPVSKKQFEYLLSLTKFEEVTWEGRGEGKPPEGAPAK